MALDTDRNGMEPASGREPLGAKWLLQYPWGPQDAQEARYERVVTTDGRVEGSLVGRVSFPLDQYLDPHSEKRLRPTVNWPTAKGRDMDAFFMEFKPPIREWPTGARPGETDRAMAEVVAYERDGTPFATGTVRRTMRLAGFETLRAGDRVFEETARMTAESELSFGWLANIRVSETAWFVRGTGLVRREEHYSGRALWLFRFGGGSRYEMGDELRIKTVARRIGPVRAGDASADLHGTQESRQGTWSHLAICLERTGRRLQVAGLAVEWAESP
jgi:hypothetical protein